MLLDSLIERWMGLGRLGGVVMLIAGLTFLAMFQLELTSLGVGHALLVGMGVTLCLLGAGRLFLRTADEKMAAFLEDEDEEPLTFSSVDAKWAEGAPLPFFICTDCRVQIQTDVMCPKCMGTAGCIGVEREADRSLVVAALS